MNTFETYEQGDPVSRSISRVFVVLLATVPALARADPQDGLIAPLALTGTIIGLLVGALAGVLGFRLGRSLVVSVMTLFAIVFGCVAVIILQSYPPVPAKRIPGAFGGLFMFTAIIGVLPNVIVHLLVFGLSRQLRNRKRHTEGNPP